MVQPQSQTLLVLRTCRSAYYISHILQFLDLGIAGLIFVDEGVLVQQSSHTGSRLLEEVADAAVGLGPKLVEERGEIEHFWMLWYMFIRIKIKTTIYYTQQIVSTDIRHG